jgi:aspartate/methionine/tyrosine aminotransferase
MQLLRTDDYLEWARALDTALHQDRGVCDLFSSSVRQPTDMLQEDLQRAYPEPLLTRLDASAAWGQPRLVASIAREYNVADESRILVTSGCSMAYVLVCRALLQRGDHAIVEAPTYQPLLEVLHVQGTRFSLLHRRPPDYALDMDLLESHITPRTKLLVLSHLQNPSAAALDDDTFDALAEMAQRFELYILVDQVYGDFLDKTPVANRAECFITINSLSKVYGLSLLRTGWIIASPDVLADIYPIHLLYENSTTPLLQAMTTVVFDQYEKYRQRALDIVNENRVLVQTFARAMRAQNKIAGNVPEHGGVFFPRLVGIGDVDAFVEKLAHRLNVVIVPGRFFGAPKHVRIGYGGDKAQLQHGLGLLAEALRKS